MHVAVAVAVGHCTIPFVQYMVITTNWRIIYIYIFFILIPHELALLLWSTSRSRPTYWAELSYLDFDLDMSGFYFESD